MELTQSTSRELKNESLQNMGHHIMLDFHEIDRVDLSDVSLLQKILETGLKKTDCNICDKRLKVFPDGQISLIFLLSESHMSFHSWPSDKCATFDFYNCGSNSKYNCKVMEEHLCDTFGWNTCTSNVSFCRGTEQKMLTNDYSQKSSLFKGLHLLKRVKSEYQDIRVYKSKYLGKVLVIDGEVQMCSALPDNYSNDIASSVLKEDKVYENVLIIGGGDLKLVNCLLKKYPLIQSLTLCEIDPMVVQVTEDNFPELKLSENDKEKIKIVHMDGCDFLSASKEASFDAVIIDCSKVSDNDSLSSTLFTNEFFRKLLSSLKPGCSFSQMLIIDELKAKFISMVENCNVKCNIDFVMTETLEYGSCTPIGVVTIIQ